MCLLFFILCSVALLGKRDALVCKKDALVFAALHAETLADAAADLCSQLKPRKALLLLQEGSSLRTLQMFMKARGHKVGYQLVS